MENAIERKLVRGTAYSVWYHMMLIDMRQAADSPSYQCTLLTGCLCEQFHTFFYQNAWETA